MAKIIIVEDDKFLVRVYKLKLEQAGHSVIFLESGSDVINNVISEKPDALILDLALPGVDGFELIREIRSNAEIKDLPIVVLSALKVEKDMKEAMDLGATSYLTKSEVEIKHVLSEVTKLV